MCEGCFYAAGSTAYRMEVFKEYGFFNEKYKYVEDWSYWVYVLRCGEKIYYADFDALCHRDGGISHSEYTKETLPPHVRQYYKDILEIYVNEIFPYLDRFTTRQKYKILWQYNQTLLYYACFAPELTSYLKLFDKIRLSDKKLKLYWKSKTILKFLKPNFIHKIKILIIYNRIIPITITIWLLLCFLGINNLKITNNHILLLLYIIAYILVYYLTYTTYTLHKIHSDKKKKNRRYNYTATISYTSVLL